MANPDSAAHMRSLARAAADKQGGTFREGGGGHLLPEKFDKNRGSDRGGSNSPQSQNPHGSTRKMSY